MSLSPLSLSIQNSLFIKNCEVPLIRGRKLIRVTQSFLFLKFSPVRNDLSFFFLFIRFLRCSLISFVQFTSSAESKLKLEKDKKKLFQFWSRKLILKGPLHKHLPNFLTFTDVPMQLKPCLSLLQCIA